MTDDLIDEMFSSVDSYYPGSKRKRREPKKVEVKTEAHWDSRPQLKPLPNGKELELFTVGALASALGRPFVSILVWNKKGYLPKSPYRLPTTKDKNGNDHEGRRLYSRAMIESVISIFDKAGLLHVKRIDWEANRNITQLIAASWSEILDVETK